MYGSRVESQMETWIIFHRGSFSLTEEILVISRCCFAEDGWEMYTVLNRTCWAIVLPRVLEITSFYRQTRSKEENITQNKAGIEKRMALFRLITLFFFFTRTSTFGAETELFQNFFFRDLSLKIFSTSHEWPKENFSLQYRYNIKHRSDENKVKYQLGDY